MRRVHQMQLKIVVVACVLSRAGRPVARCTDWARVWTTGVRFPGGRLLCRHNIQTDCGAQISPEEPNKE